MRFLSLLFATTFIAIGCSKPDASTKKALHPGRTGDPAVERQSLEVVAEAMRAFHADTGGWPFGDTRWSAESRRDLATGGVDATAFSNRDVALLKRGRMPACDTPPTGKCWKGPYLIGGDSLADEPWVDAWGRYRYFAIIPPEGLPGSVAGEPDGAVVIWSRGPDGADQTGCADGGCTRDLSLLAQGKPSGKFSDDIVVVVGPSR